MAFESESWKLSQWHCPNCGVLVCAYRNRENKMKTSCKNCGSIMIRVPRGRRHDTIELYAPKGQTRIE